MPWLVLLAGVAALGCTPYVPGLNKTGSATVFGATGVGATAVHRRVTGGCWANCQPGTQCDRDSGLCVPIPCGGCPVDTKCVATPRGPECVSRASERRRRRDAGTDALPPGTPQVSADSGSDTRDGDAGAVDGESVRME